MVSNLSRSSNDVDAGFKSIVHEVINVMVPNHSQMLDIDGN